MGLVDKLRKEVKSIKEDLAKEAKNLRREIRDYIKPPSTFEEVKRVGADMLNDLEKEGKNLKGDIKDIFVPVIKAVKEGLKEAKDAAGAGEIFEKLHDKVYWTEKSRQKNNNFVSHFFIFQAAICS